MTSVDETAADAGAGAAMAASTNTPAPTATATAPAATATQILVIRKLVRPLPLARAANVSADAGRWTVRRRPRRPDSSSAPEVPMALVVHF